MSDESGQGEQELPQEQAPKWGDPISPERQVELDILAERQRMWVEHPAETRGHSPLQGVRLTGAEVFWLAQRALAGPEGDAAALAAAETCLHLQDPYERRSLELSALHLEGASLNGAHLEGASLSDAHLEHARLSDAHLEGVTLDRAHLERAILYDTHLERARLNQARLEGAALEQAYLQRADFYEAHLERTTLQRAHLETLYVNSLYVSTMLQGHLMTADWLPAIGGFRLGAAWP